MSISNFNRDGLVKISIRLNFTSYLIAAVFLLIFVLTLGAAPQEHTAKPAEGATQARMPKIYATHRTEPEESEIGDRQKRNLKSALACSEHRDSGYRPCANRGTRKIRSARA